MTKTPPKDIGASVRARLLGIARAQGEDFQLVLTRYANERLLFRLASSRHAQRFVLKGAALFTLGPASPTERLATSTCSASATRASTTYARSSSRCSRLT